MKRRQPGQIVVLEDFDEDFETVLEAARRSGLNNSIRRASTGGACMTLLQEMKQKTAALPALLILDLNTPEEDGREALRYIKQHEHLRLVPLVILSSSANAADLEMCYAHGANAYHLKPLEYHAHLQTVQEIFEYWLGSVSLPEKENYRRL